MGNTASCCTKPHELDSRSFVSSRSSGYNKKKRAKSIQKKQNEGFIMDQMQFSEQADIAKTTTNPVSTQLEMAERTKSEDIVKTNKTVAFAVDFENRP